MVSEVDATDLNLGALFSVHAGIAHTRWATHGVPSPRNGHPQSSGAGNDFLVVHNGIITNYEVLKETLIRHGFTFESDTDTEVIPKLAKFVFDKANDGEGGQNVPFSEVVSEVLRHLEGAYALIFKSPHYPNELIACRRGSPLLLGVKHLPLPSEAAPNPIPSSPPPALPPADIFEQLRSGEFALSSLPFLLLLSSPLSPSLLYLCRLCDHLLLSSLVTSSTAPPSLAASHHLSSPFFSTKSLIRSPPPVGSPQIPKSPNRFRRVGYRELAEDVSSGTSFHEDKFPTKNGTPKELFFSSDANALIEHTKKVLLIEDDEVVHLKDGAVSILKFDHDKAKSHAGLPRPASIQRALSVLEMEVEQIKKGHYEHFMQKEIHEQPESLTTTMRGRLICGGGSSKAKSVLLGGLKDHLKTIRRSRRIVFIGCGTSYNAALAARPFVEVLSGMPVTMEVASDLLDREGPIYREDTAVFVSQSGETADTLLALKYAKENGALCVGITNTVGSAIARNTDCGVHINAGAEIGVASTKAYTSQIVVMAMMALAIGDDTISSQSRREAVIDGLFHLPNHVREVLKLDDEMKDLAKLLMDEESLLMFGRGYNYATALEGALKVKEVALMHSEGILAGEMKHGPLALVDETLPIIVIATHDACFSKQQSVIQQLHARKGRLIVMCSKGEASLVCPGGSCRVIEVPQVEDCLQPVVNVIPLQALGIDPQTRHTMVSPGILPRVSPLNEDCHLADNGALFYQQRNTLDLSVSAPPGPGWIKLLVLGIMKQNPKEEVNSCTGECMARSLGFLVLILLVPVCTAAVFRPISESHKSAALELFSSVDGSLGSLEETYEAARTFQILGVDKNADITSVACPQVVESLLSLSSEAKDLFHALRVNSILRCQIDAKVFEDVASKLQAAVKDARTLFAFYYPIGSLVLIKDLDYQINVILEDADGIFHSIKALSQSDGRWRFDSNSAESSIYSAGFRFGILTFTNCPFAGLALEALAGVVSLAGSDIDPAMLGIVKNDVVKLFDSLESYDDGALYFDDKFVDASEHQGPLSTTSAVVRGITKFAAVTPGKLNHFYSFDLITAIYSAFDIFEGPAQGIKKEDFKTGNEALLHLCQVEVKVNTVLGSGAPPLTVNLVNAVTSSSNEPLIQNKELEFDPESSVHSLDVLSEGIDVGKYTLIFEVLLHDPEHKKLYATGGGAQASIFVTGSINIDSAEIAVLDSDLGSIEIKKKLDLSEENAVSLSANHLQKLCLSFLLTTPLGHAFNPHQNFLALVDQFYYLSGRYNIRLTIGDAAMENSFTQALGHVELDLPEAPEKAAHPPPQIIDRYARFGPKQEISHIFRAPEKRPPRELSLAFMGLTFIPFIGFVVGLIRLGVNLKNFPSSAVPATFAALFHGGIAAVLLLYVLFWVKVPFYCALIDVAASLFLCTARDLDEGSDG
ncbi:Glutamine--fructose-6-phosphate aminotransferase [isomerizing] 2 [Asimina triloba]